jgi:hypothetical protein
MKDLFVSYEQALELKELGFDEPCLKYWNGIGEYFDQNDWFNWNQSEKFISIPLKQQVFKWFREKYNIIGLIEGGFDMTNIFTYCIWEGFKDKIYDDYYGTYEEAEDVLINILIDKVKNK